MMGLIILIWFIVISCIGGYVGRQWALKNLKLNQVLMLLTTLTIGWLGTSFAYKLIVGKPIVTSISIIIFKFFCIGILWGSCLFRWSKTIKSRLWS